MEEFTRKKPRCNNCAFYEKRGKTTGYCYTMKMLLNYRFSYEDESGNYEYTPPPLKPIVHRFGIFN